MSLPELSRFELDVLRRIWARGEASARDIQSDIRPEPTYSTVRKIIERLEEKGAVERVRQDGRAWIYTSAVSARAMIRKEVRRLVDVLFDGRSRALVSHLAETAEITLEDLEAAQSVLDRDSKSRPRRGKDGGHG